MSNHEEHEGREGREEHQDDRQPDKRNRQRDGAELLPSLRMRLPSPLSAETESVMTETIGCAIAVHRSLGPGVGLLLNFRAPTLKQGLRGIVL
jgi:hypothetical protein